MRDFEIREILKKTSLSEFIIDNNSKVVEELSIPVAGARIDMAVINGALHGYEIKSAVDTLKRLPSQLEAYSKVFDYLSIVTEKKHCAHLLDILPSWVGLYECLENGIDIIQIQHPKKNAKIEGFYIAKLLWRIELIEILNEQKITFKKKERNWILCELLATNIEAAFLSSLVRAKLKLRENWKETKENYVTM